LSSSLTASPCPDTWAINDLSSLRPSGSSSGDLSVAQRRWVLLGILALHGFGVWGLLQVNAVREAVRQVAPIFVSLIAPVSPPSAPKPIPQAPKPLSKPQAQPKPAPLIAAPPTPAPSAEAFVVPIAPQAPTMPTVVASATPSAMAEAEAEPPAPALRQIPGSAVQFLQLPQLLYPRLSQRHGETGLVIVRAHVGTDGGAPHSVQVEKSSGHARLDQAALAAVQRARFKPYAEKGQPVEGWALIPIRFELEK
jgi:periplasmic protein TonB